MIRLSFLESRVKIFEKGQRFGQSFMLPIAILPAAGLLLAIGGALSNANTIAAYPFLDISWLQAIFMIFANAGTIVFANLSVLFAVGVAVGLSKEEKGTAGVSALLAYLVMNATINAILKISGKLVESDFGTYGQGLVLGIHTLETGVFGGVVIGILTSLLNTRYSNVVLPQFLGFFGGSRFVPIISSFFSILVGIAMVFVWPYFQKIILSLGVLVDATGYFGTFIYGFVLRILGPLGLHHIFYLPFWTTALGGSEVINGKLYEGVQRIFFAQLADPSTQQYYIGTARFMSGRFITMMFGLIGACLAMYHTAHLENRKKVSGVLLPAALASFFTGITEPIEFSFLFIAPLLYILHAVLDSLAFVLAHMLNITIGQTFSGGFIDFLLFGVLQGESKTHWMLVPMIGIPWFLIYYFLFRYFILHFDLKTPGREDVLSCDNDRPEDSISSQKAEVIITALGGKDNIRKLYCCSSCLQVKVWSDNKINEALLTESGAHSVIKSKNILKIVYESSMTGIKNEIETAIDKSGDKN